MERKGLLSVDELRAAVAGGDIDTVVVAIADRHGRLQGKRFHARFFVDHVLEHGTEACNYLLAVDVDMNTVDGYEMSSWSAATATSCSIPTSRLCGRSRGIRPPRW